MKIQSSGNNRDWYDGSIYTLWSHHTSHCQTRAIDFFCLTASGVIFKLTEWNVSSTTLFMEYSVHKKSNGLGDDNGWYDWNDFLDPKEAILPVIINA